jgi:hypothetical protein
MPLLKNPRHERFAQLVASGKLSHAEAFRQAGYAETGAKEKASRLMTNDNVAARSAELRTQNAEQCQMSREEALAWLTRIILTGAGSVQPNDALCQSYTIGKHGTKLTMPDKIAAARQLANMTGWLEPEKVRVAPDQELLDLMKQIRAG